LKSHYSKLSAIITEENGVLYNEELANKEKLVLTMPDGVSNPVPRVITLWW